MAVTDIVTLALSIFFLVRGASRGFMRSLTVPFSIIAASVISIIYYQATQDMVASLLIGLVGPLLLNLLLKLLLKTSASPDVKTSFLSRWGGAVLTLVWGWVFIIFTLILLTVLPPWEKTLAAVHNDVMRSSSYLIAKPWKERFFPASKQNASTSATVSSSPDARSLANDPRFQTVLQDPDIQQEINTHDIVKLMGNPKMMDLVKQIMSDPATMKKVMNVYSSQAQVQTK